MPGPSSTPTTATAAAAADSKHVTSVADVKPTTSGPIPSSHHPHHLPNNQPLPPPLQQHHLPPHLHPSALPYHQLYVDPATAAAAAAASTPFYPPQHPAQPHPHLQQLQQPHLHPYHHLRPHALAPPAAPSPNAPLPPPQLTQSQPVPPHPGGSSATAPAASASLVLNAAAAAAAVAATAIAPHLPIQSQPQQTHHSNLPQQPSPLSQTQPIAPTNGKGNNAHTTPNAKQEQHPPLAPAPPYYVHDPAAALQNMQLHLHLQQHGNLPPPPPPPPHGAQPIAPGPSAVQQPIPPPPPPSPPVNLASVSSQLPTSAPTLTHSRSATVLAPTASTHHSPQIKSKSQQSSPQSQKHQPTQQQGLLPQTSQPTSTTVTAVTTTATITKSSVPSVPDAQMASAYRLGRYTPAERRIRLERYREKRANRNYNRRVKYDCRKTIADKRRRVQGRFVKREEEIALAAGREQDVLTDSPSSSGHSRLMQQQRHLASSNDIHSFDGSSPNPLPPHHSSLHNDHGHHHHSRHDLPEFDSVAAAVAAHHLGEDAEVETRLHLDSSGSGSSLRNLEHGSGSPSVTGDDARLVPPQSFSEQSDSELRQFQ